MTRLPNWTVLLTQFIQERKNTPFSWGENDCCLFSANAVLAMTGYDPATQYRGQYKTALGATRTLKKHGHSNVEEALTAAYGSPVPRLTVRRGDVVLIEHDGQDTAGIMYGQVVVPGMSQLETVSPLNIKKVWRIG